MTRIKTPVSTPATREKAAEAVAVIALAMNERRARQAALDADILALREAAAPQLKALDDTAAAWTDIVQQWAEANPAEFVKKKSVEFPSGTVGFRTGTPKLKQLRRATWDAVLDAMRGIKRLAGYIRVAEEINKEKILADYSAGVLVAGDLELAAMRVVQDESFFVEPLLSKPETRTTVEAA